MPDAEPLSPEWWLRKLSRDLADRQPRLKRYDDYYEGTHPLGFATPKFREAFGGLFKEFADNWCDLVVDAVRERLKVTGFRLGKDTSGDARAWRIWQANALDAESQIGFTEALIAAEAYMLVWWGEDDTPAITVEHPSEVIVAHAAGSRRQRSAALKRWLGDDGHEYATLYLPDALYKFRSRSPRSTGGITPVQWEEREVGNEAWPLPNPLGVVPMVPIVNRPRLLKPGASEIKKVIPIQDGVNKLVADMLVASEFGAAPQRWATGIDVPTDRKSVV